ncbi:MAG: type II toxin-antitoxin system VapC family toxin [Candidatus Nanopelagicales bacterium]|nr:type II toxin-antitoxin system VapC family toxin [Candidatus Nanopelagicales bacterium]
MTLVIDASVMVSYLISDEHSGEADAILSSLNGAAVHVPTLWVFEIASAFRSAEIARRIDRRETDAAMTFLRGFPAEYHHPNIADVTELSRAHALSVYDSSYLSLCMRDGLPLATYDGRLRRVAGGLDIPLLM